MINLTITVLSQLVEGLPIGTNLALLQFMWMLVSGALLPNRGAMFPSVEIDWFIGCRNAAGLGSLSERCLANRDPAAHLAGICHGAGRLAAA